MSTVRAEPAHLAVDGGDHLELALADLVRLVAVDLGRSLHRAGADGAPGRHDRVQCETEPGVEGHRLGVAGALDRPRAVGVAVARGRAGAARGRHRDPGGPAPSQLRQHPVVLPHEGLRHPDDGPALLGHPRTPRVRPQEVAGAVLAPPLILDGVARHGEPVAGRDAEQPALERRHGRGHVVLRHLAERHHGTTLRPMAGRRAARARSR